MDALTAGSALIAVQLCVALIMAGTFYTIPEEKCTRYWAQSGVLIGLGALVVVINAGAPNYALLIIGNNCVIAGLICQWWGLQAFHGRQPSNWGWVLIGTYFVLYALLLVTSHFYGRSVLASCGALLIFALCLRELWRQRTLRFSFASAVAVVALLLLVGGLAYRAYASARHHPDFLLTTKSTVGVLVVFFVPMVGTLLFSFALLLLYFERLVRAKHHLATHDELTALLNRRAVINLAERKIDRATRSCKPLAVAYIDVDHFKQINDELGHENGDTVLAELAQVLKHACRSRDLVGRYGGEEFCVVFPDTAADDARMLGEKIVDAVRTHRFSAGLKVTVSMGFALLPAHSARRPWTALINEADAALYRAKELGRDRFCFAGEAEPAPTSYSMTSSPEPGSCVTSSAPASADGVV